MSDTCKYCTARGDIKMCRATPCHTHDSWYAQQQDDEIERLEKLLEQIASLSHSGGSLGLSETGTLTKIRKLSIEFWNKDGPLPWRPDWYL